MSGGRRIHLDAVGGIAGDMFVAALLDAFPELADRVLADVGAVLPAEAGRALLREAMSGGLRALRFGVAAPERDGDGSGSQCATTTDTRCAALVRIIRTARLHDGTADAAVAILTHLARVEARIHGQRIEDVHFHELADWDSLADVVAAGSIAAALADARWSVSDLPLGGGVVRTHHGMLPVPAPATAELLQGFRWRDDGVKGERVTPTGAAILRHLTPAQDAVAPVQGRLAAIGTGAGTRDLGSVPNVLRALVFEHDEQRATERVAVVSFDVDDMTGEEIGVAADLLRGQPGVLDVVLLHGIGKKGRPLTSFRLLVQPESLAAVQRRCFAETSTIGLRWRHEQRSTLPRTSSTTATPDGANVRVKHVARPGGDHTHKAESDDLASAPGLAARRTRKSQAEK